MKTARGLIKSNPVFWRNLMVGVKVGVICSISTVIIFSLIIGFFEYAVGPKDQPVEWALFGGIEELIRGVLAYLFMSYYLKSYASLSKCKTLAIASATVGLMYRIAEQFKFLKFWITYIDAYQFDLISALGLSSSALHFLLHIALFFISTLFLLNGQILRFLGVCFVHASLNYIVSLPNEPFTTYDYQSYIVQWKGAVFLFLISVIFMQAKFDLAKSSVRQN